MEVDLLSLSLSRDMPAVLRPVADPVVSHIARESVQHTLDAVDRLGRALGDGQRDASIAGRPHVDTGRAEARAQPGRQ